MPKALHVNRDRGCEETKGARMHKAATALGCGSLTMPLLMELGCLPFDSFHKEDAPDGAAAPGAVAAIQYQRSRNHLGNGSQGGAS